MHLRTWFTALLLATLPLAALAQSVPPDFSYQGQLLDASDAPLLGPVNLRIHLYQAPAPFGGETALFIEDHLNIPLDNGVFTLRVGMGTPILGAVNASLFVGMNRFLEVHVNGEQLLPRQPIGTVPYAFRSAGVPRVLDSQGQELGVLLGELGSVSEFIEPKTETVIEIRQNSGGGLEPSTRSIPTATSPVQSPRPVAPTGSMQRQIARV